MIIKSVKISGFERVYDGYKHSYDEKRNAYGKQLPEYLAHSMISIDVDDIGTVELFYLKMFSSSVVVVDKTYKNFVTQNEDNESMFNTVSGLIELNDTMLNDSDINKNTSEINNILPIGCIRYHVIAIFQKNAISNIVGFMMDRALFFENNKIYEDYPGDNIIEKTISGLFFNNFYKYIATKMEELDLVTEFMLNDKFYNYADSVCSLAHINTINGNLEFFGKSEDELNFQIRALKKSQEKIPYYLTDKIYITFVMKTTFNSFFKIYMNTNYITDHENLKIAFTHDSVNIDEEILEKYVTRIFDFVNQINEIKTELYEDKKMDLSIFNYILNGSEITYSVQIPMSEINGFLESVEFDNESEFEQIKKSMTQISKMVEKLIG